MKKNIFILIVLFGISFPLFSSIIPTSSITVNRAGPYYPGEAIGFNKTCHEGTNRSICAWKWGDGTPFTTHPNDNDYGWQFHTFSSPGTYTVYYIRGASTVTPSCPDQDSYSITISPSRYISASTQNPAVGQSITFNAYNFVTPSSIRWNMGDGTDTMGSNVFNHTYSQAGTYTVRAYDNSGTDSTPQTLTITVSEIKYITASTQSPSVGQTITFNGVYFNSPNSIRWNMGDGTVTMGTNVFTHSYSQAGTYTVRAYDYSGDDANPATLNITVTENRYITISPMEPFAGQELTITAVNFITPNSIKWDLGDGTILSINTPITKKNTKRLSGNVIQHTYSNPGTYVIKAYDLEGTQNTPISLTITVLTPNRRIGYQPRQNLRVDQLITFRANGFLTNIIDWNFGDGTILLASSRRITHRFQNPGLATITAKDSSIDHTPIVRQITILPENRSILILTPEVRINEPVQVTALNFRGDLILWNFGDGTQISGGHTVTHTFTRPGTFIIKARDENGESQKEFITTIVVRGITDEVNLEIAELRLDNGKHYKIVPRNSKDIRAILRMKMRGTGTVSGYFLVDGKQFSYFNELAVQGELKEIYTDKIPGIPTLDPGMHTISVRLIKPSGVLLTLPVLQYFVLSSETIMETTSPKDGFIAKEKEIPLFSWKEPRGGSKYKIAFSNYLHSFLMDDKNIDWIDVGSKLSYTPSKNVWNKIKRNKWSYWKVKAFDTNKQFIAESGIQDIKVVIATAEVSLNSIKDLDGNEIKVSNGIIKSEKRNLLVNGDITYKGDSKYLILRVYSGEKLIDQLLFRDVKKDITRSFETSIPNTENNTKIKFEVLKTSSPSVIIGIKGLILKRK